MPLVYCHRMPLHAHPCRTNTKLWHFAHIIWQPPALACVQVYQSELEVIEGALPADLSGAFLRNGPNPKLPVEGGYHW